MKQPQKVPFASVGQKRVEPLKISGPIFLCSVSHLCNLSKSTLKRLVGPFADGVVKQVHCVPKQIPRRLHRMADVPSLSVWPALTLLQPAGKSPMARTRCDEGEGLIMLGRLQVR